MKPTKTKSNVTIYIIALILLLQIVGSIAYFRFSNSVHAGNLQKINTLINEIGQLKQQNQILNEEIADQGDKNQLNEAVLKQIYVELSKQQQNQKNLESYQTFLEAEKKRLSLETSNLANQLNEKQDQIVNLEKEKEQKQEFKSVNQKLLSVLFLGTNQHLTDTILLAVVNPEKEKTTLISIPRDLFYKGRKINEYYEFYGIEKTKEIIQEISGLEIDKYIVFNFQSFKDLVNSIGGVDIDVKNKITDNQYPTGKFDYKTVVFNPGLQKMDGNRTLEYARSRKSTSDFDRSKRQQQIIIAIEQKLLSMGIMKNVQFYVSAYQTIQNNLSTNFNIFEAMQMLDEYKNFRILAGNVLSNENFLYSSKSVTGQSILLPEKGNFLAFQQKVLEII